MSVRGFALVALMFGAGALASFVVVGALVPDPQPGTAAPTTTVVTTTVPVSYHVDPNERIVGPAALVPVSFSHSGSEAAFEYELHGLAPVAGLEPIVTITGFGVVTEVDAIDVDPVYPATWTLTTADGEVEGTTANPRSRVARFPVADDFNPNTVEGLRLDTYMVRVPVDQPVRLPRVGQVEVVPEVRMSVIQVVEQGGQTIVQVEVSADPSANADEVTVEGDGPGWLSAVRETEGRPRWNLRYDGVGLGDEIPLRLRGSVWMEFADPVDLDVRELS
jgi:hypothetical protein